ncbi:MAG: hypothetical protein M5T61_12120 [Acidimicrobiia bacterium]|nr:hypothetical protein [Acidimicrobiia bacterium]
MDPLALREAIEKAWSLSGSVREYPSGLAIEIEESSRISGDLGPDASYPDRVTRQISVFLSDRSVVHVLGEGLSLEDLRSIARGTQDLEVAE